MPLLTRRQSLIVASAALVPGLGCSSDAKTTPSNLDKLPPFEGRSTELFNDFIEPAAFGLTMDQPRLQTDPMFRERAQAADVIFAVRVTTVTSNTVEDKAIYTVQFEPLKGYKNEFGDDLRELRLSDRTNQAYSIISTIQAKARGQGIIGLWKRFREKNRGVIHFYFAPDNADSVKAIHDSLAMGALKTQ